jgi:hypothetical protein
MCHRRSHLVTAPLVESVGGLLVVIQDALKDVEHNDELADSRGKLLACMTP